MDKWIAQLESVLTQQVAAHQKLLSLLQRKRKLLSTADHEQLKGLSQQENQIVQEISELEKIRLALVGQLTLEIDETSKEPMRLAELANRLPEPDRDRLLTLRALLKQQMEKVSHETAVAKRATESLVRHMQGLVYTVGSMVSGMGLYSRQGNVPKEAMAVRTFHVIA